MSTLSEYIKARPEKNRSEWAECFGISRPHLYALVDGTRQPSLPVAVRIHDATGGEVPITSWPRLAEIARIARLDGAA